MYTLLRVLANAWLIAVLLSACSGEPVDPPIDPPPVDPPVDPPVNNTPPTASISRHAEIRSNGMAVYAPSKVVFGVNALDVDGNLDYVELLYNGERLGPTLTQEPFEWQASTFDGFDIGNHRVTALAWDKEGAMSDATKTTRTIKVVRNAPPTAEFTEPSKDAEGNIEIVSGSDLDVKISALDDLFVENVELLLDNVSLGKKIDAPFDWLASTEPSLSSIKSIGPKKLTAIVTDSDGEQTSIELDFNVIEGANGKVLWQARCVGCHGVTGEGNFFDNGIIDITLPAKTSYPFNNQQNSLVNLIKDFMPWGGLGEACDGECAQAIANYITGDMAADRAARAALIASAGNAAAGETIYANQCQQCHGPKAVGSSNEPYYKPLLPIRSGFVYRDNVSAVDTDIFTLIELRMPPNGKEADCDINCVVDVMAYLRQLASNLSANDQRTIHINRGREVYASCVNCHGRDGSGRSDQGARINFKDIRNSRNIRAGVERMYPTRLSCGLAEDNPQFCIDSVTVYLQEVLLK